MYTYFISCYSGLQCCHFILSFSPLLFLPFLWYHKISSSVFSSSFYVVSQGTYLFVPSLRYHKVSSPVFSNIFLVLDCLYFLFSLRCYTNFYFTLLIPVF
uniref:Uncharacterized protein n=1 Tax=Cacopsylla melanoneura TaxID=428564 RepID=A0A8D8T3Y1_9HEMI